MLKSPCYKVSIDAGEGWMLVDVAGQPYYHWDADSWEFHSKYDALHRPTDTMMNDGSTTITLSKTTYGEGATNDKANNLRGQVLKSYDGAGKHYVDAYDFKGMPAHAYQQLLKDATIADADWHALTDADLDSETFTTTATVDALSRMITTTDPGGNITAHTYEKDGALKTVAVNSTTYVQDIHHNAKGQREAIWYGNGTKTSYTYEPLTYRLSRLLTINLNTSPHDVLQDLNYYYDPSGNITMIRDDAQETVFFRNTIITPQNEYTYDALYRLIQAKGRESIAAPDYKNDNTSDYKSFVSDVTPWDGSLTALRHYAQGYTYDEVGNMLELQHSAGTGSYTRDFTIDSASNRLLDSTVSDTYSYDYDNRGNLIDMPHLSEMDYDSMSQMTHVTAGTTDAYYQYSGGQRIRKMVKNGSIVEYRIYLGSYEIYRKFGGGSLTLERTTVHIADDAGRIAMLEVRTQGTDPAPASLARYIYSNHLGSSALELDESADVISYEEYHPYGTTAYQAMSTYIKAVAKRYRFTGKERDEESGLNYHGARYYIPWLCRWAAVDPLESKYTPWSPYAYVHDNPVVAYDPTGKGDYYFANGNHAGNDGKTVSVKKGKKVSKVSDDKAYVISQEVVGAHTKNNAIDWDGVIGDKRTKLLSISNSTLGKFANAIARESSGDKTETYALGSTVVNLSNYKKKDVLSTLKEENIFGYNGEMDFDNTKYGLEAAINALTGGHDYSNGAIRWDGFDLAAKGFDHNKPRSEYGVEISKAHFDAFKAAWPDEEIQKFGGSRYKDATFAKNFGSGIHPTTEGNHVGTVLLKSSAVLGRTMFYSINRDPVSTQVAYERSCLNPNKGIGFALRLAFPASTDSTLEFPLPTLKKIHYNANFKDWNGL